MAAAMAAPIAAVQSFACASPRVRAQLKGSGRGAVRSACLSKTFSGLHCIDLSAALSPPSLSNAAVSHQVFLAGGARYSRHERNRALAVVAVTGESKNILMLGGTRFIGLFLARLLVKEGHQVTLFTRGKAAVTSQLPEETDEEFASYSSKVKHIKGDRQDFEALKSTLAGHDFNVVYDINGREATEAEAILNALPALDQHRLDPGLIVETAGEAVQSAGFLRFKENSIDKGDPKSRHKGKLDTEALLESRGVKWTSIRPVYIYGPLNYNPVEEWFFHRLKAGRPIPIPSSGLQVTQLGHVKDLATAFVKCLGNEKAIGQVYNVSGSRYVTFDGIARACAKAGGFPEPELVHYKPKDFDFGKKKAFPLRDQHFFTSIEKAQADLEWTPEFGLVEGLADSYNLDFGKGTFRKAADFSVDDMILEKVGKKPIVSIA